MAEITLESLIREHKERILRLKYKLSPSGCIGLSYYYYEDEDAYQCWLAKTKRYININYPKDKDVNEFEKISKEEEGPEQQQKLLAILEAFVALPTIVPNHRDNSEKDNKREAINVTIHNANSQSQNQEQSMAAKLFIEAIKDDLTGRQIKELKAVVAEADNDLEKARAGIISKLKDFGVDVASNIIANILTNPIVWGGL